MNYLLPLKSTDVTLKPAVGYVSLVSLNFNLLIIADLPELLKPKVRILICYNLKYI